MSNITYLQIALVVSVTLFVAQMVKDFKEIISAMWKLVQFEDKLDEVYQNETDANFVTKYAKNRLVWIVNSDIKDQWWRKIMLITMYRRWQERYPECSFTNETQQ